MRKLKHPLTWLLISLGLVASLLFYAVYLTTDKALQRAEAFQFQRMTIARLDKHNNYRFFYATNRIIDDPKLPLNELVNPNRSPRLSFGYFDTTIEPTLGLGMFINPTAWFQDEEISIGKIVTQTPAAFSAELRPLVEQSPLQSLLIIVHGYKEEFQTSLRKTAFLSQVLDVNTPTLVFDWPGNQGITIRGYHKARQVAADSGAELAQLLDIVASQIQPQRIWLVANSMGAEVVTHAMAALYQRGDWADDERELDHIVLTAPDVAEEEFTSHFKPRAMALTRRMTVYVSSNDRALVIARIVNRKKRLGESPINPSQLEEAASFMDMTTIDDQALTLIDVTPVNRTRNFHNFSLQTPEFYDDLYLRLTNAPTPGTRLKYRVQTPEGKEYWVLTRGR